MLIDQWLSIIVGFFVFDDQQNYQRDDDQERNGQKNRKDDSGGAGRSIRRRGRRRVSNRNSRTSNKRRGVNKTVLLDIAIQSERSNLIDILDGRSKANVSKKKSFVFFEIPIFRQEKVDARNEDVGSESQVLDWYSNSCKSICVDLKFGDVSGDDPDLFGLDGCSVVEVE